MTVLDTFTNATLQAMRKAHTYRSMRCIKSPEANHIEIAGNENAPQNKQHKVILLASNSYLDLCNEPALKQKAAEAVLKWGTGSGGARLTTGNKTPHEELEQVIADFKGEEAAITFGTGYMANVGVISALCSKQIRENGDVSECVIFSDELNHASIIDGIRLSRAKCSVYRHNDLADLEQKIVEAQAAYGNAKSTRYFIVTDAVFSMDGDLANLPDLQKIAIKYNALLMIDEAHATGVIGHTGRGLAEHFNDMGISCDHADVTVGTLSKAVGCEGGFAVGKQQLIEFLRNKARSFIFTTAMSPAMAASAASNLKFIADHPERVQQLQKNVEYFCKALKDEGIVADTSGSVEATSGGVAQSAIVPIIIGNEEAALKASAALLEKGILIPAIRYPTVAKGQARLRASLMATHTQEDLKYAAQKIAEVIKHKG